MKYYLVGGAIRDRLLNLTFSEKDYVVIGETEASMQKKASFLWAKNFQYFCIPRLKKNTHWQEKKRK